MAGYLSVQKKKMAGYLRNGGVAGKAPGSFLHGKFRWTGGDADNSAPVTEHHVIQGICYAHNTTSRQCRGTFLTTWRSEHQLGSRLLHVKQGHQDLGTMTHCWSQQVAQDPEIEQQKLEYCNFLPSGNRLSQHLLFQGFIRAEYTINFMCQFGVEQIPCQP